MRHINYIPAFALLLALGVSGCDKSDTPAINDDMQQIDGIVLGLGELAEQATTRASVGGVTYAVNTSDDPTYTHGANFITARGLWKLDFNLYNGNPDGATSYPDASFTGGTYSGGSWKPNPAVQLLFPNYFRPEAEAWLYPDTRDKAVEVNQSDKAVFLAQDLLIKTKGEMEKIEKKFSVQLQHLRSMINFKFEDIVRANIDEPTVRVFLGSEEYIPYNVRPSGTLEFMLILPETSTSSGMRIEYSTVGNALQQPIEYVQEVTLNSNAALGSNNAYCFTLSGKEMRISPVTIINWVTGEPVSGEYVAVTAYPTFKGPKNSVYYFYYDNKITDDGTPTGNPVLQRINFNNDWECTIKPDGRIITHIFPAASGGTEPIFIDEAPYKLASPVILGGYDAKMYIDLTTIISALP
jgi:hypothetical protein